MSISVADNVVSEEDIAAFVCHMIRIQKNIKRLDKLATA